MTSKRLYRKTDSEDFCENVEMLLAGDIAQIRSIDPDSYVNRCRKLWRKTKIDRLYSRRMLVDDLLTGDGQGIRCVVFAKIDVETDDSGTQWSEPKGYRKNRKELGRDRRELIFVYPTGSLRPETDTPEPSVDMVALFDVLGFEAKLKDIGLEKMHVNYRQIIHSVFLPSVAQNKLSVAKGMFAGELREGYMKLRIRYAYFSDTLIMWTPFHNAFVGTFLDRCSSLLCNALAMGFPLRGAISVGKGIMHSKSNTFLGEPLVEAARLEAAQESLGVALGVSVRNIGFPPDRVQKYDPPVKKGKENLLSGLTLDWPRFWRDFSEGSPVECLKKLSETGFSKYYDSAIEFVRFSTEHKNWFVAELEEKIGPFTSA